MIHAGIDIKRVVGQSRTGEVWTESLTLTRQAGTTGLICWKSSLGCDPGYLYRVKGVNGGYTSQCKPFQVQSAHIH